MHSPTHLPVDDDIHKHVITGDQSVDGPQTSPEVIGIEHLKLCDGLEFIYVIFWYLARDGQSRQEELGQRE